MQTNAFAHILYNGTAVFLEAALDPSTVPLLKIVVDL